MLARLSLLGAAKQAARRRWIESGESFFIIARSASSSSTSNHSASSFPFAPRDDPVAIPKLLISNRGEIACRIIHTARRLGVPTVAVFSDADARAPHVSLADEAVRLGPPPPSQSYLDAARILAAARASGATAVHPGYGFLSESAPFAEKVVQSGLTWVGPPPAAMRSMGDKARAKELMSEAGVPVVPGYHGEDQSDERLCAEAERVGFPILIKAVLGGGGKGMKVARNAAEVPAAVGAARREAAASFGCDRLLLERLVARPRHLEVQVLADAGCGTAVHLGERDCSVQRRHQKVIEEAPGPGVSEEFRAALGAAAVAAAEAVRYEGVGTVEFIVGEQRAGHSLPEFFFMEMNTRLQVEHPVTEAAIAGHPDLVEWQLRVAAGERLPAIGQRGISLSGSVAVEARLYAERPEAGFLPAAGVLSAWRPPRGALEFRWPGFQEIERPGFQEIEREDGEKKSKKKSSTSTSTSNSSSSHSSSSNSSAVSRRADAGVRGRGDAVGVHYDPMIAKILAKGPTREAALAELARSLESMRVGGISTNAGLLWRLSKEGSAFRRADGRNGPDSLSLDTHFLETHAESLLRAPRPGGKLLALAAAAVHAAGATSAAATESGNRRGGRRTSEKGGSGGGAWSSSDGARPGSGLPARRSLTFSHEASGSSVEASLEQTSEGGGGGNGEGVGVLKITTTTTKAAAAAEGEGEASSSSAAAPPPETSTTTLRDVQLRPPSRSLSSGGSSTDDGVWTVTALDAESGARLSADVAFGDGGSSSSSDAASSSDVVVVDLWPASNSSSLLGPLTEPCVSLHLPVARHWASPEDLSGENRGAALSPMPGKVARVSVAVGDRVKKGDTLCLLEAMKMEHPVRSPIDGVVKELDAAQGALVGGGERLALVVAEEEK